MFGFTINFVYNMFNCLKNDTKDTVRFELYNILKTSPDEDGEVKWIIDFIQISSDIPDEKNMNTPVNIPVNKPLHNASTNKQEKEKEEEEDSNVIKITCVKIKGIKYLLARKTNKLYNYEGKLVAMWNPVAKTVTPVEDESETDEEDDDDDDDDEEDDE